ncbi:MAG: DUF4097 family beta strand repeat protein [Acidobacteria bacterium]|nr:DUF4097 family beta strand repeat protein [Acidobacteriota bacterium]MBI3657866.1 DUF4097 family beta strand repeat protein [Acidobacteriota bacterium]
MSESNKRGSLVWGVIFVTGGTILLLQSLGYAIGFWRVAAKSWPLLLVLAGLGKIYDSIRWRGHLGLRFRDVGLVIVILFFGAFANRMARINLDPGSWKFPVKLGQRSVIMRDFWTNSYTYEEERSKEISSGNTLVVENTNGTVEISAGAVEDVKVRLKKVIYEDSETKAKQMAEKIVLVFQEENQEIKVKTSARDWLETTVRYETHLMITVPRHMRCRVENRNGEVRLDGLVGDQEVHGSGGAININDIEGAIKVENKNKETNLSGITGNVEAICSNSRLTIMKVSGDVSARNAFARTEISEVEGKVTIRDKESSLHVDRVRRETDIEAPQSSVMVRNAKGDVKIVAVYNRPIRVEDALGNVTIRCSNGQAVVKKIKGTVAIESTYGDVRVSDIEGPLTINAESSSVQAEDIKGITSIQTTLKDVLVNVVENQTTIHNKYGAIAVAAGRKLQYNLTLINENGKIDLVLPEDSNFALSAVARSGGLQSQFSSPKLLLTKDGDESISGVFGTGGPAIKLETTHEAITIRKGTEIPLQSRNDQIRKGETRREKRHRKRGRQEIIFDHPSIRDCLRAVPFFSS